MRTTLTRGIIATGGVLLALQSTRSPAAATTSGLWQAVGSGLASMKLSVVLEAAGPQSASTGAGSRPQPGNPDAHYALGQQLQQQGKYDESRQHYREFIRLRPSDARVPAALAQIGRSLLTQGRKDEAMAAFRDVLARKAGDPDGLAGVADTLFVQEKWADSVPAYQAYLRVKPDTVPAMMNLGEALVRLDRDGEGRELFRAVTELQPGNVTARVNYAYALANTGLYSDSVREFRKAAELEKDPKARAAIEAAIAELLGNH